MAILRSILPALLAIAWASVAWAQAPGQVRAQGVPVETPGAARAAPGLGVLTDYRDEMRRLVMNVAAFARKTDPGFAVITHNCLDLLEKVDEVDQRKVYPARAYMLSVDAVMQDAMYYGFEAFGKPTPKERKDHLARLVALAKQNRIKILSMDFVAEPKLVDAVLADSRKQGFLPFVAHKDLSVINSIPPYPKRPFRENPNNILSMAEAQNYLYLRDTSAFGLEVETALQIHDTNFDIVVVDVFHGRKPFTKRAIETMKYKNLGARRMVLARMDVGTAANYRYYWQPNWQSGAPRWITAPYPTDPDRFFVEYWRPEWHKVIYGDDKSFTYGLIAQGFDGVVIEGVESYRYFESDGQDMAAFK